MAFVEVSEQPFSEQLIDTTRLVKSSFNPVDYFDSRVKFKVTIHKLAPGLARVTRKQIKINGMTNRVLARFVSRTSGEVIEPDARDLVNKTCLKFDAGDILFHKMRFRIGRIGLTEFAGFAESEFVSIKPQNIDGHYLLLALRSIPVMMEFPFRETTRPRVKSKDIEQILIPRLEFQLESGIGEYMRQIFKLRRRVRKVLAELTINFGNAVEHIMPTENTFLKDVSSFSKMSFDPGVFLSQIIEKSLNPSVRLGTIAHIIHPTPLDRGDKFMIITAKNYTPEGIIPEYPRGVQNVLSDSYARSGDLIMNRILSGEAIPWKTTPVLDEMDFLSFYRVSVRKTPNGKTEIPVSEDVFIIRTKNNSDVSPYYLWVVLNSKLFRLLFTYKMGGSTGMQVLKKTRLENTLVPILGNTMQQMFSQASQISLEINHITHSMIVNLTARYEDVISAGESPMVLNQIISSGTERLNVLGASIKKAESYMTKTRDVIFPLVRH